MSAEGASVSRPPVRVRWPRGLLPAALVVVAAGCGGSGSGQSGGAFVFLTVESVSPANGVTSSLADKNTSSVACVTLRNNPKNPTVTTPTGLDSVFIQSYTVRLARSDGGPAPPDFTVSTAVTVPSGTISSGMLGMNTAKAAVIVVTAPSKNGPPLTSAPLPLSANALVTFKGKDGRGESAQVTAGIPVLFVASGTDVGDACAGITTGGGGTGGTTGTTTTGTTTP